MTTPSETSAPAAPAPAPAPAAPASSEAGSASNARSASLGLSASAEKVLSFDPATTWDDPDSAASAATTTPAAAPAGSAPDGATETPVSQPGQAVSAQGAPASGTSPEDFLKLQKQLNDANALIAQMKQTQPQGQPQGQPQAQGQPQPPAQGQPQDPFAPPDYMYSIPMEIVSAIQSEDPQQAAAGIQGLVSGVARGIHQTVMGVVLNQIAPQLLQAAVQQVQRNGQVSAQHQEIRNDFYGRYKEFDRPEMHAFVAQVATQLAQETGAQGYSAVFGDALASRLRAILAPQSQPQPQILGGTPPRTSFVPNLSPQEKDLMDLMS